MAIEVSPMTPTDYDVALALWQGLEGIGLSEADSREAIEAFLTRHPGLSLVARDGKQLVGAVLCGHDGRRGYLYHLAVARAHREHGIGRRLVELCLARLAAAGIQKCHIFVHADNQAGAQFWRHLGYSERTDLKIMSCPTPSLPLRQ